MNRPLARRHGLRLLLTGTSAVTAMLGPPSASAEAAYTPTQNGGYWTFAPADFIISDGQILDDVWRIDTGNAWRANCVIATPDRFIAPRVGQRATLRAEVMLAAGSLWEGVNDVDDANPKLFDIYIESKPSDWWPKSVRVFDLDPSPHVDARFGNERYALTANAQRDRLLITPSHEVSASSTHVQVSLCELRPGLVLGIKSITLSTAYFPQR
ncbi:hypothetical protein [Sorangium sp. So ce1182]|uniref:hypothetical protein n=1 Tax=Sorangium sp. So ce1182 TaxID=3133334 RepID=UPI003F635E2F